MKAEPLHGPVSPYKFPCLALDNPHIPSTPSQALAWLVSCRSLLTLDSVYLG
ncbi:hypothetical protein M419DRAFT_123704 [Trichoderma reesei RUT C-30]|uniref:Uncharacterized protein n=1 Tax=Hypocrea jecorina (strain ATCC 56765 / BCRC 32924 / NRRL 11460 / Rut C-30) TaxID=1344414 RepID=A0A024S7C5_HYPJR|nr:hypothetical protein M419DRAFT_123704 [Trichoderma reesei RUT C-30]